MLSSLRVFQIPTQLFWVAFGFSLAVITFEALGFSLPLWGLVLLSLLLFFWAWRSPDHVFLVLLACLPFETLSLLPNTLGVTLRPYQWIGALLIGALLARLILRRPLALSFRFHFLDLLLGLIPAGALVTTLSSRSFADLTLTLIALSYYALYLGARVFFSSRRTPVLALSVFLGSATATLFWGIIQNILFLSGSPQFSVMPGRPNATFPEADWFGLFLLFIFSLLLTLFRHRKAEGEGEPDKKEHQRLGIFVLALGLILTLLTLILTVSRSAWLGALVIGVLFVVVAPFVAVRQRRNSWREAVFSGNFLIAVMALAVILVMGFDLTRFELFSRAESTVSGMQRITVSCSEERQLPPSIENVDMLAFYNCRHITLEEIKSERNRGAFVTTVLRPDPNVVIRKNIYLESWRLIGERPILGSGWSAIGERLGTDERGASLNASNTILELWIGSGLLGMGAFLAWLGLSFFLAVTRLRRGTDGEEAIALYVFLGLSGMVIFNFFNSGLLLGFLWVFFALVPLLQEYSYAPDRH